MSSWRDRVVLAITALMIGAAAIAFVWLSALDPVQHRSPSRTATELTGTPLDWQLNFPLPASPMQRDLYDFHNFLLAVDVGICAVVAVLIVFIAWRFRRARNPAPQATTHNTALEIAWTIGPVLILTAIAVWSFPILAYVNVTPRTELTLKVTGRQWYWDYAYPDNGNLQFSSTMVADNELKPEQRDMRLLAVDNEVVLPVNTDIRIEITGGDVVHSWSVPSFGVKRDAIPGRINDTWTRIEREGVYHGQCYELCGRNHAFMPIVVRAVSKTRFQAWLAEAKQQFGQKRDAPPESGRIAQASADNSTSGGGPQ